MKEYLNNAQAATLQIAMKERAELRFICHYRELYWEYVHQMDGMRIAATLLFGEDMSYEMVQDAEKEAMAELTDEEMAEFSDRLNTIF